MRLIAWALLFIAPLVCEAQQPFAFTQVAGRYGVGLRIVLQHDSARTFPSAAVAGQQRPIQTLVWYPAKRGEWGGNPLIYDDYVQLIGSAEDFSRSTQERQKLVEADVEGKTEGKLTAQIASARAQAMWAVRDAPPAPAKFPVVIYAPSFSGDAFQNADLCEYLASHGYVVIASPALGTDRRSQSLTLPDIDTQAADVRFLINYAASLPQADTTHLAVIGYSIGGLASVFAAARDGRITALVQLDGSVRYFNSLVRQAGDVTPDKVAVPMLYLAHRPLHDAVENQIKFKADLSGSFLNDMKAADLYLFNINALDHRDFSSWFIRIREVDSFKDYSPAEVSAAYGWVARYVLEFLNGYANSDAKAKDFLSARPEDHGVPRHLIEKVIQRRQ